MCITNEGVIVSKLALGNEVGANVSMLSPVSDGANVANLSVGSGMAIVSNLFLVSARGNCLQLVPCR